MEKKRRIVLYLPLGTKGRSWSGLGGAEKRLSYLISHMNPDHFQPCIVLRVYHDKETAVNAIKEYISSYCDVRIAESDFEAFKLFWNEKYDYVLYDDCMVLTIPGVLGAWLGGSHRILIFVTQGYAKWKYKKKWHGIIMRFNGFLSSSIDCLYPMAKPILEKKFPNRKITVTPCSLPRIEDFACEDINTTRENKLVFAARLVENKNPLLLLDAIRCIKDNLYEYGYQVIICGDGPLKQTIIERIKSYGLESIVSFLGSQKMQKILPSSLAFLSLQEKENYPSQSLLEAISSGCIIIATDVGETRLIVKPEFGILIQPNKESLVQAILKIMEMNTVERQEASIQARWFSQQEFQPQKAIMHYEDLCKNDNGMV